MQLLIGTFLGILVSLFGIYIAQSVGLLQVSLMKKEYDLNLRKSAPELDSTVRINSRQVNPAPVYNPFHYIVTSIHNHGDLPAKHLKGHWRMYSPDKSIQDSTIPIRRDALGSAPLEFSEIQLIGPSIDDALKRGVGTVTINVDIEFDYFGLSENQPQHYSARWQYDRNSKQMIRQG
jgi:hypothetical protein